MTFISRVNDTEVSIVCTNLLHEVAEEDVYDKNVATTYKNILLATN